MKITDPVAVLALDLYRIWYRAFCEQGNQSPSRPQVTVSAPSMTICLDRAAQAIAEINKA